MKNIVVGLLVMVSVGLSCFLMLTKDQHAYVDINSLYEGFQLRKELNTAFESVKEKRAFVLDSLKIDLEHSYKRITGENDKAAISIFEKKRQNFIQKQEYFEQDNQRLYQQYEEQILSQINQYVKDYGNTNSYDYIYGANGMGNIMFANDANNISEEVIQYINDRYDGKSL